LSITIPIGNRYAFDADADTYGNDSTPLGHSDGYFHDSGRDPDTQPNGNGARQSDTNAGN
jgi:hypothetical protein